MGPIRARERKQRTGGEPGRGVRVRKPRGAVSTTSRPIRRFVERIAASARSRARASAGGNSPDEMSGIRRSGSADASAFTRVAR
jgi:hypothetical protein